MEVLDVREQQDEQYEALLKSSAHANVKKNSHFFTHERYQGTTDPAQLAPPSEEEEDDAPDQAENQIVSALK